MKYLSFRRVVAMVLGLTALLVSGCTSLPVATPAAPPPTQGTAGAATPLPAPTATPFPVASSTATSAPPTVTALPAPSATAPLTTAATYISAALGISFSYLPEQNGQTIKVHEESDKIYVYPAQMEPTAGQWVQVFEKPAGESLVDAITRLIMPGHPAENCQVVPVGPPAGSAQGTNFEYAQIVVPPIPGEDMEAMLPRWQTCPQPYTVVGGIGYFQADASQPDKFLFFSIGQYGILAGEDQPWQATIKSE